MEWEGQCPLLAWNCLAVWNNEGWDVTVGDKAGSLLVVGEEGGTVRLYRYCNLLFEEGNVRCTGYIVQICIKLRRKALRASQDILTD